MDLNKLNPEINYKGKHVKISLATVAGMALTVCINPTLAAMVFPTAWVPVVTTLVPQLVAGGGLAGLLYSADPNGGQAAPPTMTAEQLAAAIRGALQPTLPAPDPASAPVAVAAPAPAGGVAVPHLIPQSGAPK